MYPDPSDWTNGTPGSVWFYDVGAGRQHICQTNGWEFLFTVEGDLSARLTSPLPTFDGTTVSTVSVIDPANPSAGAWSTDFLRALYAVAQQAGAPQSYLQAIASDASSQSISPSTLATAAWIDLGYDPVSQRYAGSPADIRVPDGSTLPEWGVAPSVPPQPGNSGFNCTMPIPSDAVVPASTSVVPFQMDAILVLVVIGVVVFGASLITTKIPVRRMRNPHGRRRRRRR